MLWAATWQNQQSDCASSEDSDQPGHPPSLTRVFAIRIKKAWVLSYPLSAQRRLWSDLSLRWAHSHFVGLVTLRLLWNPEQNQKHCERKVICILQSNNLWIPRCPRNITASNNIGSKDHWREPDSELGAYTKLYCRLRIFVTNPGRFAHFPVRPWVVSPTFPFAPSRFAPGSFRPLSRSHLSRFAHFPVRPWVVSPPYKNLFTVLFRPQKCYKALIFLLIDSWWVIVVSAFHQ